MDADVKAMEPQRREEIAAAIVRERDGQRVRKAAAEAELSGAEGSPTGDRKVYLETTVADASEQIRNAEKELKRFAKDAKTAAKRTTKAKATKEER
jgi:hypothetical protein